MAGANKGKTSEDMTKEERAVGKITNFGFLYGQAPKGFMSFARKEGIELTFEQASAYHSNFFRTYPGIKRWHLSAGITPEIRR